MEITSHPSTQISLPWKWRPFKRHMLPGCEFFADGDEVLRSARKLVPLETGTEEEEEEPNLKEVFPCGVFGCTQSFSSLLSYENHYNSVHRHACSTCHRTFPSLFLLDIHLQEQHDSLFTVLAGRHNMYRCLVEQCEEKFPNPKERRDHLVKVHKYPANFRFHRDTASLCRKQQKAKHRENKMEVDRAASCLKRGKMCGEETSTCMSPTNTPTPTPRPHDDHRPQPDSHSDKENTVAVEMSDTSGRMPDTLTTTANMEVESSGANANVKSDITQSQRVFVHRVPGNFSFGHGVARGFHRPLGKKKKKSKGGYWHEKKMDDCVDTSTDIANVDMTDMATALEDV